MMLKKRLIAITGDIGSGKSVVARILTASGFNVYDCDTRASLLMNSSDAIISQLRECFGPHVIDSDGKVNRRVLGDIVFADAAALSRLNFIVHSHVRQDLREWARSLSTDIAFVETAILYQSELDLMVDEVWDVFAPRDIRLSRVQKRNGFTEKEALERIEAQESFVPPRKHASIHRIVNDGVLPLIPQIEALLS